MIIHSMFVVPPEGGTTNARHPEAEAISIYVPTIVSILIHVKLKNIFLLWKSAG
jgi:hypothetical protein